MIESLSRNDIGKFKPLLSYAAKAGLFCTGNVCFIANDERLICCAMPKIWIIVNRKRNLVCKASNNFFIQQFVFF
ncbi:hypothetical protein SODG_001853 [Sodalis praecaptivus]